MTEAPRTELELARRNLGFAETVLTSLYPDSIDATLRLAWSVQALAHAQVAIAHLKLHLATQGAT
jgi:hypothetical protein